MLEKIEYWFEWLIWQSRLIVLLAVVSSIIASAVLIITGTVDIALVLVEFFHTLENRELYKEFHTEMLTHVISAIDAYLIATVLLIFGVGLYELFISKIDFLERDTKGSGILVVHSLDELKEKLAKVILMVLIVVFFKHAVHLKYDTILNLLYLGIGIFFIAVSIFLTGKKMSDK
ncbi:MAG: YqhA family protein [Nitrospinota bacterium]|nr:YqhA family protein [Nitrospinota bacterium]